MIELRKLSFKYQKKQNLILDDISYTFMRGKLYTLKGNNGAGKTTLGKIFLGLLKPSLGAVFIDDMDTKKIPPSQRAQKIGYMFQNPALQLFAPTVYEELTFPYELSKRLDDTILNKIDEALLRFNLFEAKDHFPLNMSLGEMQRLALATIMLREVQFLILDEPSSALDEKGRVFLGEFLNEFVASGGGVLLISHDDAMLKKVDCTVKLLLKGGKLTYEKS